MHKPLLSISEAATVIGVSTSTAYRMVAAGQLPTINLCGSGSLRVVRSKLVELYGVTEPPG